MDMFFFDEAGELEEYQIFRKKDQPLELEYERLRRELLQAEQDKAGEAGVIELKEKLAALERQAPWLTLGYPLEYLLWGPPHG